MSYRLSGSQRDSRFGRPVRLVTVLSLGLFLLTTASSAQDLGRLSGKVADTKGTPIPAATVRLFSQEPGPPLEVLAELDGTFAFPGVPAGPYRVVVEMSGFESKTLEAVSVQGEANLDVVLSRPGATAPAPARTAQRRAPPGTPARADGGASENPPGFQAVGLAGIAGAELEPVELQAGVSQAREDNSDLLVISGNSTASIGGGDWNDPRFRERIMEMAGQMGFGGFDGAAFGRGGEEGGGVAGPRTGPGGGGGPPGAGRIQFGGPGGGRGPGFRQPRLNGSLFSNYRNSVFNARPYSITGSELDKPLQIQNSFGASAGGPLPWGGGSAGQPQAGRGRRPQQPGMWFFSYEGSRNRNPFDSLTSVPRESERAGDFSLTSLRAGPFAGQPVTIFDPLTRLPFPGNRIPQSRWDPAAAALLQYVPLPNLPGSVQNFTMQRGLINASDSFSGRVNGRISPRHNAFFNYSLRTSDGTTSQIFPGLDTTRSTRAQNFGAGGNFRFQPRFILNYRVTFNRVRNLSTNPFAFQDDVAGRLNISGTSRDPVNYGPPTLNFTNYGDLQLGNPSLNRNQTLTAGGGLNRIGNRHTIQAGGDFSWIQRNSKVDPNARGSFEFTGFATSAFDSQGRPLAGTGYDLADFLLGFPYGTSRRFGSSVNYLRNRTFNLFIQDNWRARPNLTVNAGLRYEYVGPYFEKFNHLVTLDVAPGFTAVEQVFPNGDGPYGGHFPRSLLHADRNNFGPRVGIAWKRKANSKWVIRTGYGFFYNPSVYPYVYSQLVGQPPFATGQSILTTLTDPLTLQNGFPVDPNVTILNTYAIDPYYRVGYVQQWNLNFQTQAFRIYTFEIGYTGSKGTGLDILRAPNRAPRGGSPIITEDNRIIENAGNFVYQGTGANSILHNMVARVTRRFSGGVRMEGSYTFGKSIDNASGIGGGLVVIQDERNLAAERALSSFDRRHRFQTEFSYDFPVGERRKYLAGAPSAVQAIISGWTLSGSYQLSSGNPLTPRILGNVSNNSGTGSNASERPDWTGAAISLPSGERTTLRYFNTDAFAIPAPGRFGNAGRNLIAGPGTNLLDLSLRKAFRLGDGNRRVELRWQVSNALNHPNFGGVGTVINALNFGRITSARSMRQMEFNLRVNF